MKNTNDDTDIIEINSIISRPSKATVTIIKEAVLAGETDPAYVGVVLKKLHKVAEEVKKDKDVQDIIETATKLYQEGTAKTFNLHGAKITIANTGFWDYSTTQDPLLEKMEEIAKTMKEQIKLRKEQVQAQALAWESKNKPQDIVEFGLKPFNITWDDMPVLTWDEAGGEVSTNPPVKKGKETLRYSL